jgi:NAD(P)-dependent dehydrogenase (short-subunit alcohol dehydrogenase family)
VVLTGPGSGLGLELARKLLVETQVLLVVLARSHASVDALRVDLRDDQAARLRPVECDLSDLGSVRSCAMRIRHDIQAGELQPVDALVLNAAVLHRDAWGVSADGIELTMATNAFGPHLLTALLSRELGAAARIVAVGSGVICPRWWQKSNRWAGERVSAQQCRPHADGRIAYRSSKLALYFLCRILGSIAPQDMSISYFDPGLMPGTGIARHRNRVDRAYWQHVLPRVARLTGGGSIAQSADALFRHLMIEDGRFRGDYVRHDGVRRSDVVDADQQALDEYFRLANEICALDNDDSAEWWR